MEDDGCWIATFLHYAFYNTIDSSSWLCNVAEFSFRPREIWKRGFISQVRPIVHANPSQKRSFSKTLFELEEFQNAGFSFSCGRWAFRNGAFRKRNVVAIIVWFSWKSFHQTYPKIMTGYCYVFKYLGVMRKENIWCVLRVIHRDNSMENARVRFLFTR